MMKLIAKFSIYNGEYYQFTQVTTPVAVSNFRVEDLDAKMTIAYPFVGGN